MKEVALRATIKDVCTLLDMKANIADVNAALMEVNKELDHRALVCLLSLSFAFLWLALTRLAFLLFAWLLTMRFVGVRYEQSGRRSSHDHGIRYWRAVCWTLGTSCIACVLVVIVRLCILFLFLGVCCCSTVLIFFVPQIWKNGKTKANGMVPWNLQTVNTSPVCFLFVVLCC